MIYVIRKVRAEDLAALRILFLRVRETSFLWLDVASFLLEDFDKETIGEQIYVATCHSRVVGFVSVWEAESFVHHLYITPDYYRCGMGKALLNYVMATFPLPMRLKCQAKNVQALAFYEQLGWRTIGAGSDDTGAFVLLESRATFAS